LQQQQENNGLETELATLTEDDINKMTKGTLLKYLSAANATKFGNVNHLAFRLSRIVQYRCMEQREHDLISELVHGITQQMLLSTSTTTASITGTLQTQLHSECN
jgi:hypothetical protein